jgi:hypothetical protein
MSSTITGLVPFTLCEQNYLAGTVALINSLVRAGFRGTFWVGYRGAPVRWNDRLTFDPSATGPCEISPGVSVRMTAIDIDRHLTHAKAWFALRLLNEWAPAAEGVAYFDPDVIVKTNWADIVAKATAGFTVCADQNPPQWIDEPTRQKWERFSQDALGVLPKFEGDAFNGGFFGMTRAQIEGLELWEKLILACLQRGFSGKTLAWEGQRELPFFFVDQDMMNLAVRVMRGPITALGPEAMDFSPGGSFLSHAISSPKPWDRWYLPRVLTGRKLRQCDIAFWKNATTPVPAVSAPARWLHRMDIALARALSSARS